MRVRIGGFVRFGTRAATSIRSQRARGVRCRNISLGGADIVSLQDGCGATPSLSAPAVASRGMGTVRHCCDKDRAAVAGSRGRGTLDGPLVARAHQGRVRLPRHLSLPLSPSVAAAFPVSVDGRNTIVPDRGTARSVTGKPPWSLGDGHAVATRVQRFPASVPCTRYPME